VVNNFKTIFIFALIICLSVLTATGQTQEKENKDKEKQENKEKQEKPVQPIDFKDRDNLTAEQVAEVAIAVNGSRPVLAKIRKTEIERGKVIRVNSQGNSDETLYEKRILRGDSMDKDKIRLDQKSPTTEFTLIQNDTKFYGIINDVVFTPRPETERDFKDIFWHSLDNLLRYKENGATLNMVGRNKQLGVEYYLVEVTNKDKTMSTRYAISYKTFRVLWLDYEFAGTRYTRRFYDYRIAQGTLFPYRSVLLNGEKQLEETKISTVTYGIKLDDAAFQEN
jgi:hypothetical protein